MITQNAHPGSCTCFRCKLNSITFDRGRPKTHVKNGDPWDGNPVKERIEELQAQGAKVAAFELSNPQEPSHADV